MAVIALLGGLYGCFTWANSFSALKGGYLQMRFGGYFRNPYVNIREFPESFLRQTAAVQLVCCSVSVIGGALLFAKAGLGRHLLIWQAKVSAVINFVFVLFVAAFMTIRLVRTGRSVQLPLTLTLRSLSLMLDLGTCIFLSTRFAKHAFHDPLAQTHTAFPVIPVSKPSEH